MSYLDYLDGKMSKAKEKELLAEAEKMHKHQQMLRIQMEGDERLIEHNILQSMSGNPLHLSADDKKGLNTIFPDARPIWR